MTYFLIYLLLMNIITFIEMGHDKGQAKKGGRRVPEKRLFLLAALGGGIGGWLGMRMWRHKTKHTSFVVGFPLLIALNCICVIFIAMYM
ncbi:DUF1294 domain-containing protein [Paenibacillus sp. LjRoot153]|uniref:DUF1294 domain-containing protein n=1 Tax=Paenibacillus allorhizoplanae TaxID=2905648 RepID=A0ABN8GBT6_9BACL|nr:DUF1294 domain-containing protein [Paenibacillus allorhizoplanae]CAH1205175.1 hypothetical protein PAECIP111891_02702 [Paenibacillus allorhizoplanae]